MQKPQTLQGFKNIFTSRYETTPYGYCFVKLSSSDPVVEKRGKEPALKLTLLPLFLYKMEGVPVQLHPDMENNTDNTIAEKLDNRNSSLITALAPQYNLSSRMMLEKAEKLYFERDALVDKDGEEMVVAVRTRGQAGEELSDEEIEEEAEQAVMSIAKCFFEQGAEFVDGLYEASVKELEKTLAVWKTTEAEITKSHFTERAKSSSKKSSRVTVIPKSRGNRFGMRCTQRGASASTRVLKTLQKKYGRLPKLRTKKKRKKRRSASFVWKKQ